MQATLSLDDIVECLKSTAEPSRLRILRLLESNDLTVSDLTAILGQSQPRVSRHLKLLLEAGLIRRWQEGSWALFRLNTQRMAGSIVRDILAHADSDDEMLARDFERLAAVKAERARRADDYFSSNAESWDRLRSLHVDDALVEQALLDAAGAGPFNAMLDIGTGTGRMLEVFADRTRSAVGIDGNRDMLNVARANLDNAGITHAEVRLGDAYHLPVPRNAFDLIVIHQVLHFLEDPQAAVREAARALAPGGKLFVVDFAPHTVDELRDHHQHRRLGFDAGLVSQWFADADLEAGAPIAIQKDDGGARAPITVMVWGAQDNRYEIADLINTLEDVA